MRKFLFLFIFPFLTGCAVHQQEMNNLADLLETQDPQLVLNQLEKAQPIPRDSVQFHLNLGFLQFITGDFQQAISTLTEAKREMSDLQAASVSENVAAGTISETLRRYSGYPTDWLMLHHMLALSYLFNHDIDDARVEILQADLLFKKRPELKGQSATIHLLGGIIYELLDEPSNALISYRDAAEIIEKRDVNLPLGLKLALLRMSFKVGAKAQYISYQKQFPSLPLPTQNNKNQVFALYFDGVVSHKKQNSIVLPDPHFNQLIRISMPGYPQLTKPITCAKISDKNSQSISEVIDDLEHLVRADLEKEYPSILLLTTSRAIAKYQLVKKAQQQDPLLGTIFNIASLLSEEADLRSWNMLPANIQFIYSEPWQNEIVIDDCNGLTKKIALRNSSKNVLLMNSLTNVISHYQQ